MYAYEWLALMTENKFCLVCVIMFWPIGKEEVDWKLQWWRRFLGDDQGRCHYLKLKKEKVKQPESFNMGHPLSLKSVIDSCFTSVEAHSSFIYTNVRLHFDRLLLVSFKTLPKIISATLEKKNPGIYSPVWKSTVI